MLCGLGGLSLRSTTAARWASPPRSMDLAPRGGTMASRHGIKPPSPSGAGVKQSRGHSKKSDPPKKRPEAGSGYSVRPKKPFEGHSRNPERPKKRFESPSRTESARKTLWKATPKISGDRKSNSEATQEIQSHPLNAQMSTPKIQNDRGTAPTVVLRTSTRGQSLGRPPSKSPQERHRPHLHRAISSAPHPKRWHRNTQSGPSGRDRRARWAGQTSYPF